MISLAHTRYSDAEPVHRSLRIVIVIITTVTVWFDELDCIEDGHRTSAFGRRGLIRKNYMDKTGEEL
jgi:hypothetical protein